jgi:predicted AlkP superfamily phosphohydrolase/phosphomutase
MRAGFARVRLAAGVGTRKRLIERINRVFLSLRDVDWSRTRAYAKGNYGQLFLNRQGREPRGIVSDADADQVLNELEADLRGLQDSKSGEPLIGGIWRKEQLYAGPFLDRAPDLTFLPRDMRHKALGTVDFTSHRFREPVYGNSGDHRMDGIFFLRGPGVRVGASIEDAKLVDVAPTILHHLGVGVPADFDGAVLERAFTDDERARPILRTAPSSAAGASTTDGLSPEAAREIRDRLKGIGYLG